MTITDTALVTGDAVVEGDARVTGDTLVTGDAHVGDRARVTGQTILVTGRLDGCADVDDGRVLTEGDVTTSQVTDRGGCSGTLTVHRTSDDRWRAVWRPVGGSAVVVVADGRDDAVGRLRARLV